MNIHSLVALSHKLIPDAIRSQMSRLPFYKFLLTGMDGWLKREREPKKDESYLLHVLCNRILIKELCALICVETICFCQESIFKGFFVNTQGWTFGYWLVFIQAELDCKFTPEERKKIIYIVKRLDPTTLFCLYFLIHPCLKLQRGMRTNILKFLLNSFATFWVDL